MDYRTSKQKSGCPYCAGRKVGEDTNLEFLYPELAKEWHPTKNGELIPSQVTKSTHQKVWWLCAHGHSYEAAIYSRTGANRTGCPFCAGKIASSENNLKKLYPTIAKQWHPTKNGALRPSQVTKSSDKKVWWLCPKGHNYKSSIANRTKGKACPQCSNQSSSPEIRIFSELGNNFGRIRK